MFERSILVRSKLANSVRLAIGDASEKLFRKKTLFTLDDHTLEKNAAEGMFAELEMLLNFKHASNQAFLIILIIINNY